MLRLVCVAAALLVVLCHSSNSGTCEAAPASPILLAAAPTSPAPYSSPPAPPTPLAPAPAPPTPLAPAPAPPTPLAPAPAPPTPLAPAPAPPAPLAPAPAPPAPLAPAPAPPAPLVHAPAPTPLSSPTAPTPSPAAPPNPSAPPPNLLAGDTYRPPIVNIQYGGGPVLWQPIHLYFVWYGTWTEAQKTLVRTASQSLTPTNPIQEYPNLSNYWSVVTQYYQALPGEVQKYASNDVSIAGEVDDPYSLGKSLDMRSDPIKIIQNHVGQDLKTDLQQGVYFLFTSTDVGLTNTHEQCAYHTSTCVVPNGDCTNPINHIVYSFVPLALPGCSLFAPDSLQGPPPNALVDPKGDLDFMIHTFLHELLELVVDPYNYPVNPGWRADTSNIQTETADLCQYTHVAGDWWYCKLASIFPDFPGINSFNGPDCSSFYVHHTALTEPNSHATFNLYGIGGSYFIVQPFWSLGSKGCVLQLEEAACPASTVMLSDLKGTIQRGQFFNGVGLQRYAAGGQSCFWNIAVANAKIINLHFDTVALGYDAMDYIDVSDGNSVLIQTLTGFGTNIFVQVTGNAANIKFISNGNRSPTPSSAGFIMHYDAGF